MKPRVRRWSRLSPRSDRDTAGHRTLKDDKLGSYRAKRSPDRTPEPFSAGASASGRLYVMQKHAARNLHYDLRLELDGVLKSWAVPKDPSYDQTVKRAAFHVEDHPVEYATFEGVIPKGNYGAGEVIVWDRGTWIPLEDPVAGLEKGKLLFELRGFRMRGRWTLVKVKRADNEWLLIKERDALEGPGRDTFTQDSILTGRTLEDMRAGIDPAARITALLDAANAPRRNVAADSVDIMLAETRTQPFDHKDWVFELKYDGYRILVERVGNDVRLLSRNGNDYTVSFPEIAEAVAALPYDRFVIDGEVVVHDEAGMPSFQRLQKRARLKRSPDVRRAASELPATLYVFDILAFGAHDLRPLPLLKRKEALRMLLPSIGVLRFSDHIAERGIEFFKLAESMRLEGIIGKKADAPYRAGRSKDWVKLRASLTDDFVVIGFKSSKSGRNAYGSLHVAQYDGDRLIYAGSVGTGLTQKHIDQLATQLEGRYRDTPAADNVPPAKDDRWVEPHAVIEARYLEWTEAGQLRHPVFLRVRDDKPASECVRARQAGADEAAEPDVAKPKTSATKQKKKQETRAVRFTNLDKVLWPEHGYTKGDLIEYYRAVSPWLLRYLRERPVVQTRFPDGIHGKSFFQKDAPEWAPEWLRTETIWSEGSERELRYFVADDVHSLEYLANAASIPLHIWSSRVGSIERPDWCSLDLDPKDASFADVVRVALVLHELCDQIGLQNYVKTSGSSGLHVLVPFGRLCTHEQGRMIGELLAREVVKRVPDIATTMRVISQREGKVYIDFLQNGHGKLLVAPYCVRPVEGAPVSAPLLWSEVATIKSSREHTIRTMPDRLNAMKEDPMVNVLTDVPDLVAVLAALSRLT
jgi:bifunctional non-homologous end joining protein LigD